MNLKNRIERLERRLTESEAELEEKYNPVTRLHAAFWLAMDRLSPKDRELVLAARGKRRPSLPLDVLNRYVAAWQQARDDWRVNIEWSAGTWIGLSDLDPYERARPAKSGIKTR